MAGPQGQLRELARLFGVQTAYYDVDHRRQEARPEALVAVLRALGAPLHRLEDAAAAVRQRKQELWARRLEPVVVCWDERPSSVDMRLPEGDRDWALECRLELQDGATRAWTAQPKELHVRGRYDVEGLRYQEVGLPLPRDLPWGYHRLDVAGTTATLIRAPQKAWSPPPGRRREWGLFLPLYALHSRQGWPAGDLADLKSVMDWVGSLGGSVVGTLPLLAAFLAEPYSPSPYAPVSRLFWNEFYVSLEAVPELARCDAARRRMASPELRRDIEELRASPLVDYRRQMALKRSLLEEMARCFFAEESPRRAAFESFLRDRPETEDYARFRAACHRRRSGWPAWPQPMRDGLLTEGDFDPDVMRYHMYAQWLTHEQMAALSNRREDGVGTYLDLPLGVHPDGYDVWRERGAFAQGVSAGAPPDTFFSNGQDWGFQPLHPLGMREQGYRYLAGALGHHLRHAGMLRIDHMMGFHRLFWVPQGMEARYGVYVRYPAEEMYAVLTLESRRHGAAIVGEDLGTVPGYVRPTMARHDIRRMYVVQYEAAPRPERGPSPVPAKTTASLNTHDMPTFAAFWHGDDVQDRMEMGLLDSGGVRVEHKRRRMLKESMVDHLKKGGWLDDVGDPAAVLAALLESLAASRAETMLLSLEDLWLSRESQNVPGTRDDQRPNWRRRARYSLEEFSQNDRVVEVLRRVDSLRKGRGQG